ncbi:hypothetical protein [Longimicrobium sp.]|jgi:hypothetical protein|uniref:hypothetical protein n=1 Tax=Longimicrobium sp. TaxID=2029185 RepID=UPI002F94D8F4
MILRSVVTVLALAFSASAAAAQQTEVLPGARIRVTQPVFIDGVDIGRVHRPQVGTLVSVDSASITALLEKDGTLLTLPFSAINRLQVSQGSISGTSGSIHGVRKGAMIGGGFIAVVYGVAYLIQVGNDKNRRANCIHTPEYCARIQRMEPELPYLVPALVGGTIGGAAIGFALGSHDREAWEEVRPRSLRPVAGPSELSLRVSLRF